MNNREIDIDTQATPERQSVSPARAAARIFRSSPQVRRALGSFGGFFAGIAMMALAVISVGCGSDPNQYNIPAEAMVAHPSSTLAVGDILRFSFSAAPELNQTQKVGVNGRVNLPMVGSVTAAGKSLGRLQSELVSLYEPHLQVPDVQVALDTPAAAVYVSGEVNKPGKVALDRPMTALEAVMESGGFSRLANPKQVFVIRTEKGKQHRYVLNLGQTLSGGETNAFYLRPFDTIYVKRSNW